MRIPARNEIPLSPIVLLIVAFAASLGWLVAFEQIRELFVRGGEEGLISSILQIAREIVTVVVIASVAAIATEKYLKSIVSTEGTLDGIGIKAIFENRSAAHEGYLRLVRDDNVRTVTLCGISLRDFLPGGASLNDVWREICARLKKEQDSRVQGSARLQVRLLVLLPKSDEGYFRHKVESNNNDTEVGLPSDVQMAVNIVRNKLRDIYNSSDSMFLQLRIYEHCPFSFVFATDRSMFVEQYDYHEQSNPASMPLICYRSNTKQYKEQTASINIIWENARSVEVLTEVGTAPATREARIKNIYRHGDRATLAAKQVDAIGRATGGSIDIAAISGRFYVTDELMGLALQQASNARQQAIGGENKPSIPVRFAIINPVSHQAIYRAVAESCKPDLVGAKLAKWTWSDHQRSSLYTDVHTTARVLSNWKTDMGCNISIRAYSCAATCMVFKTEDVAFVEQYVYGRGRHFDPTFNLGGEYPVFEYDLSNGTFGPYVGKSDDTEPSIESVIVINTFEIIFNQFGVPWDVINNRNLEDEFERNILSLRS